MRPAPRSSVGEGLQLPGHDLYGPMDEPTDLDARLRSLWGGLPPGAAQKPHREAYERAVVTWTDLAEKHPGTAGLWDALAFRAATTLRLLG